MGTVPITTHYNRLMSVDAVVIYGKDTGPYTQAAREAYAAKGPVSYLNVRADPMHLARMLQLSGGKRKVPVIVEQGVVTIGFGGT